MADTKVLHGGRIVIKMQGKIVGLGINCTIEERTPLAAVEPVGQLPPAEYIRMSYEVDISFSQYRVFQNTIKQIGLFPETADPKAILEHEEIIGEVYDLYGPGTVERFTGFKIESVSRSYQKSQLATYECRGKAIKVIDEAEA